MCFSRDAGEEEAADLALKLPGQGAGEARAAGGVERDEQGPRRPLVQEVGSQPAESVTPEHELTTAEGTMTLRVKLPRVAAASELELEVGDAAISLSAEGLYRLQLALPAVGMSAEAGSKFDKKRRVLTVTVPLVA